jgi:hypothetical protein
VHLSLRTNDGGIGCWLDRAVELSSTLELLLTIIILGMLENFSRFKRLSYFPHSIPVFNLENVNCIDASNLCLVKFSVALLPRVKTRRVTPASFQ